MIGTTSLVEQLARPSHDASVALVDGDRTLTYADLRRCLTARSAELDLPTRSLVVLVGDRSLEHVVTYLALLDAGHVPIPVGDHGEELADTWGAAAVIRTTADGPLIDRREVSPPELHPELALLLSTSGSTGSPKLVRLSHRNLVENARSIADYLDLDDHDVGITTLPLHYCYGLSVLHSHLASGAAIVVSEASVVDPCFREALERHRVTNVAGVPHTFELLERADPEHLRVPGLRFVTQAGGRLEPDAVRRWIDRTSAWGADFYVMYGQTEATARIAYLPPEIAHRRPEAIGVAIPGGTISLRPARDRFGLDAGVGELVYEGPNVMLGYAERAGDLARGRDLNELPTGDLARFHADDGVFEIVGRTSRFVKPFGVRVDLGQVECALAHVGEVAVAGDDRHLVVAAPGADADVVRRMVGDRTGLPPGAITVDTRTPLPRTSAGKPDYPSILSRADDVAGPAATTATTSAAGIYASVLDRQQVRAGDTFVGLGGDSLSYIECSIRLEQLLGQVPRDWHLRTVGELDALGRSPDRPGRRPTSRRLDTTVPLRAIGICLVVATHMRLWHWPGGAHLLLAVVGYNFARFVASIEATGDRVRAGLRTISRVAIPTVVWTGAGMLFTGAAYGLGTLLLVNNYVGPMSHVGDHWHFWFIEVFTHVMLAATLLLAVPAVHRADRRFSYGLPLAILLLTLIVRLDWSWLPDWDNYRFRTHSIAWFMVLGWLVQRSESFGRRVITTALCLLLVPGFFGNAPREWSIAISLIVLIWARELPVPAFLVRPTAVVASASMWILISHFTVWPPLVERLPLAVAYTLTIGAGVVVWAAAERLIPMLMRSARLLAATRRRPLTPVLQPA